MDTTFIFLKILGGLALPPASMLVGLIVGGLLALMGWRRLGKTVAALAVVETLALSFPPVADLLMQPLQRAAREAAAAAPRCCYDAIVVLGGGITPAFPPYLPDPDLSDGADRMWEASRLYHRGLAPRVIVTGGSYLARPGSAATTEADAMRRFLIDLGVPASAIVEEGRALNTAANIANVRALVNDKPVALVTSAHHMPRALRLAKRGGLDAAAFPTDWRSGAVMRTAWENWLPSVSGMSEAGQALWEIMGLTFDRRSTGVSQ